MSILLGPDPPWAALTMLTVLTVSSAPRLIVMILVPGPTLTREGHLRCRASKRNVARRGRPVSARGFLAHAGHSRRKRKHSLPHKAQKVCRAPGPYRPVDARKWVYRIRFDDGLDGSFAVYRLDERTCGGPKGGFATAKFGSGADSAFLRQHRQHALHREDDLPSRASAPTAPTDSPISDI